jgi:ribosomal protein S18 acetylase RimI-like enzyme
LPTIRHWEPLPAERGGGQIHAVADRAFRGPPHTGAEPRDLFVANWKRRARREGFRLLTIEEPGDRVVGFLYGYRGSPGRWWFDTVSAAVSEEVRKRWLADAFEIVSMAIDPVFQGRGWGTSLLRECLAVVPFRSAVRSTHREANVAVRLYLREGFQILHGGLAFSAGGPPFVVLGRGISSSP